VATEPAPQDPAAAPAHAGVLVTGLTFRYQGTSEPAIIDISCDVPPGAGLCVTGPEGAGKTTLIRALVGLVPPGRGTVSMLGGSPELPAIRRQLGYGPERMPFPRGMRVRDAVRLVGAIRGTAEDPAVALERVGLPTGDRRVIATLELGEVRRVSLACAITGGPRVLVLDDPWEYPETVEVIRSARADGAAVVVGTPDPGGFPALLGATLNLVDGAAA
jgi:ABC-type multidrug transport system ATPase subunit